MLRGMAPVLKEWGAGLEGWEVRKYEGRTEGGVGLADFDELAYTGVLKVIRVVGEYRERVQNTEYS
jgi:hypothetical protein